MTIQKSLIKVAGMRLGPKFKRVDYCNEQGRSIKTEWVPVMGGDTLMPSISDLTKHSRVYAERLLEGCRKYKEK